MVKTYALATLLVLLFSGCVVIPYPPGASVSIATEDDSRYTEMVLSIDGGGLIDGLDESISSKSERIDFVDPSEHIEALFPNQDYRLSAFLDDKNRRRITTIFGIDYAVFVVSLDRVILNEKGDMEFFGGIWGAGYHKRKVSCHAVVIDLHTGRRIVNLSGEAQGISGGVGLFYGVFIFADEDASLEQALAREIVETLLSHSEKEQINIAVFALNEG